MHLSTRPPNNLTEDRLIALLDRDINLSERAIEMDTIRLQMRFREKARLKFLLQQSADREGLPVMALNAQQRGRLSSMLAIAELEQNNFDAERISALNAIERFLKQNGLRLRDLATPAPPPEHKAPLMGTWRDTCRRCLERKYDLRPWEIGFVTDLPKFTRLSSKQRYILNEIAERIGARP